MQKEIQDLHEKKRNLQDTLKKYELELLNITNEYTKHQKKIENLNAKQQAIKILMNSCYGCLGNPYFRYYDVDIAEGITTTGRVLIQYMIRKMNEFLNKQFNTTNEDYVIFSDTDSIGIRLDTLIERVIPDKPIKEKIRFIDRFSEKYLAPVIETNFENFISYFNCFENHFSMKREAIANKGIWRKKKNYVLQIYDNEGVLFDPPYLKMVGIETQRSSTPTICRDNLKKGIDLILNGSEKDLQRFVIEFREVFMNSSIETIAFPRGVSDIDKWVDGNRWKLKTPIHVKASIMYNSLRQSKGLQGALPTIKNGDKIKFIYLKDANPIQCNVIAFIDHFPKEFGLDDYIDKETQFQKTFIDPLDSLSSISSKNLVKVNTLESFFM